MKGFHRVMVATDLTPTSGPAFRAAVDLAAGGAELTIVHAYQPPAVNQVDPLGSVVYGHWDASLRAAAEQRLQPLVEGARRAGVDARALLLSGPPAQVIVQAAEDNGADVLVLGTHGRKGMPRFFLGSVASRVISTAPCPVLTIRAALRPEPSSTKERLHAIRGTSASG